MRKLALVDDDGGCLRAQLRGKGQRIGFQRQMLAAATDDVELVVVAGARMRDEQLPIADAAHPHRMPPCIPEIEIADHADAPRVRCQHHKGDAVDALERHRVRSELVVDALVGAFAEQIEVELAQYRREAVGILELDDIVAEAGAELIAFRAVRQRAGKQTSLVDPRQGCRFAMLADGLHVGRFGEEGAYDALARPRCGDRDSGRGRSAGPR